VIKIFLDEGKRHFPVRILLSRAMFQLGGWAGREIIKA